MPNKNEKGLNRGGIGGQEGELGDESKNLDMNRPAGSQQDKPGQQQPPQQRPGPQQPQRPGQQPQPRPGQPQQQPPPRQGQQPDRPGQQRGGMQGGSGGNIDPIRENRNPSGGQDRNMNQQRGGLRREPDLEDTEKDTGHEVD